MVTPFLIVGNWLCVLLQHNATNSPPYTTLCILAPHKYYTIKAYTYPFITFLCLSTSYRLFACYIYPPLCPLPSFCILLAHTILIASLTTLCDHQSFLLAVFCPESPPLLRAAAYITGLLNGSTTSLLLFIFY